MTSYWKENSKFASEQEMMLDSNAEDLGQVEVPEVLGLLPDLTGKSVLELGAGIGRYTSHFAVKAKSVIAVDFMEKFTKKNKELNGHYENITFKTADVTKLKQEYNSVDVVFSNWLMMYLDNEEAHNLIRQMLHWLKPGGYAFIRESCFHSSGNASRTSNPTHYRTPATYNLMMQAVCQTTEGDANSYGFNVVLSRSIQAYVKLKNNPNQVAWLVQKVGRDKTEAHGYQTFQEFLDKQQYSETGILRYEKIFGEDYISTGGKETTEEFVKLLDLKPKQVVLDVGCGIGGSAFLMAKDYGTEVLGIDLSTNMVSIALERGNKYKDSRVQFEVGDATKREFPDNSFNVIYSRDTILHIPNKPALFTNFLKWLKPGGKLLISDYCCSADEHSETFKKYVAQRGYNLLSVPAYGKLLEQAGFINVRPEDRTNQFVAVLKRELRNFEPTQKDFVQEFSQKDYDDIVNGWNNKIVRCGQGDQRWGLFYAEKPVN